MNKFLSLFYDDFHYSKQFNCIDSLQKFINKYPEIKITLFTSPNMCSLKLSNDASWCDIVRNLIESNNIELGVHGYSHVPAEFSKLNVEESVQKIMLAENIFNESDLKFMKLFEAPNSEINKNVCIALDYLNYTHLITNTNYINISERGFKFKNILPNWFNKDAPLPDSDILISGGHTHNTSNNYIKDTYNTICGFIENNNPTFKFISEL